MRQRRSGELVVLASELTALMGVLSARQRQQREEEPRKRMQRAVG